MYNRRHLSSSAGITHHKLHRHVHLGNGQGTLAAMDVLSARTGPSGGSQWEQLFQTAGATLDERQALRRFFLQVSCIPPSSQQPQHALLTRQIVSTKQRVVCFLLVHQISFRGPDVKVHVHTGEVVAWTSRTCQAAASAANL